MIHTSKLWPLICKWTQACSEHVKERTHRTQTGGQGYNQTGNTGDCAQRFMSTLPPTIKVGSCSIPFLHRRITQISKGPAVCIFGCEKQCVIHRSWFKISLKVKQGTAAYHWKDHKGQEPHTSRRRSWVKVAVGAENDAEAQRARLRSKIRTHRENLWPRGCVPHGPQRAENRCWHL